MPEGASTKLLLVIGAGVALAASAAVWVVPMGFLSPKSITGADEGAPPFPDFTPRKAPVDPNANQTAKKDWLALESSLESLRDKPPPVAESEPASNAGELPPIESPELHWQYLGFAGTAQKPAAFMALGANVQRVVFPNDIINDANDPNGAKVTIKTIDLEKVVVESNGKSQTFEIVKRESPLNPVLPSASSTETQRPTMVGGMPGVSRPNPAAAPPVGPVSPNTPGVRAR